MNRTIETTRDRRAFAYGRSVEWLGDEGIRRTLADRLSATVREVREGLRTYSRQSLVAGRIPAFLPRGASERKGTARTCCAPACCA